MSLPRFSPLPALPFYTLVTKARRLIKKYEVQGKVMHAREKNKFFFAKVKARIIRDLKIEVFWHFPRTAKVKKSRDQGLAVRFAVCIEVHVCTARPRSRGK